MDDLTEQSSENWISRRTLTRFCAAAAGVAAFLGASQTQNAVANGDTRTLSLYHAHTQESITVTFRQQGSYDRGALDKLNRFLRDWRNDEQTNMDPRLFDVVWATWREVGSSAPVRVVSSYRSPVTNNMLRRRSSAVAKNSQHMVGKAMDLHMPDVSMAKVREIGMRLQNGGVGYYPTAGTPFVHLDVGGVRSWPRMPRPQLERLFPDGKTVHLPADGTPLAGYEAALAEIQTRGGSALSYADISSPRRSLWAALFGGEDEEVEVVAPRRGRGNARAVAAQRGGASQQVASLAAPASDSASVYAIGQPAAPAPVQVAVAPPRPAIAPKPQPLEEPVKEPVQNVAALKIDESRKSALPSLAQMPIPPRRPADLAATALAAASVPLPPIRPAGAMAAFAPTPEATGSIDKAALPAAITAGVAPPAQTAALAPTVLKLANVPTPPLRPAMAGKPETARAETTRVDTAPPAAHPDYRVKMDSAALAALMSDASGERGKRPAKVELPSVRQTVGSRIIAGKFDESDQGSAAGKFTGTLSRPLHAGFVKRGE